MVAKRRLEDLTIKEIAAIAQKATRLAAEEAARRRADAVSQDINGKSCSTSAPDQSDGHLDLGKQFSDGK